MNLPEKYILLAEDDLVVAELVLHTLASINSSRRVVHVRDGVEAIDFLHARGSFQGRAPGNPTVMLLDLKMPRLDGFEVLRHLRGEESFRCVPVVVLTASQDEGDIREAYNLGANAYIVKPVEFRNLLHVLQQIENFWLGLNHPPPPTRAVATSAESR